MLGLWQRGQPQGGLGTTTPIESRRELAAREQVGVGHHPGGGGIDALFFYVLL